MRTTLWAVPDVGTVRITLFGRCAHGACGGLRPRRWLAP